MDSNKSKDLIELDKYLLNYREMSLKIIAELEKDNFDNLEKLINDRQGIIDNISKLNYSSEDFASIAEKLELTKIENKMRLLMQEKRNKAKRELDGLNNSKQARKNYTKGFQVDSIFFNKKI